MTARPKKNVHKRPREVEVEVAATPIPRSSYDNVFKFLLDISEAKFFESFYEKDARFFHRSAKGIPNFFYRNPIPLCREPLDWSSEKMVELAKTKTLFYGTDLNVVRFDKKLKKRIPFKTSGPVNAEELQKCFREGWSVRFLRPNEHSTSCAAFVDMLESIFKCSCGVNSYWTPKNSQGFAPHYDDVDVFLLQLEGSKRWRLYKPPEDVDYLSRHSSEDYLPEDVGSPLVTATLRAGDVLYMPRGCVHQGDTPDGEDSLHITFSATQMHSFADLFLKLTSYEIETLAANDIEWRRGIPREWFDSLGAVNSKYFHDEFAGQVPPMTAECAAHRPKLLKRIREFLLQLTDALNHPQAIDNGVDRYAVDVLSRCQPPSLDTPSAPVPQPEDIDAEVHPADIDPETTKVALINDHCIRLVMSVPDEAQVFHLGKNSHVCLETDVSKLRFEKDFAPAIATLITMFPAPILVKDIPMPNFSDEDAVENRLVLVEALLEAGVLKMMSV